MPVILEYKDFGEGNDYYYYYLQLKILNYYFLLEDLWKVQKEMNRISLLESEDFVEYLVELH